MTAVLRGHPVVLWLTKGSRPSQHMTYTHTYSHTFSTMFSPYFAFHYPGWFNLQSTGLFLTADILICHSRKITGVTNDINNYDSVTVRQHAQYQD